MRRTPINHPVSTAPVVAQATRPLFPLGALVATPAAVAAASSPRTIAVLIRRHITGDWADLPAENVAMNRAAIRQGVAGRVFSAYAVNGAQFYLITEADRSVTTVMLSSEYLGGDR